MPTRNTHLNAYFALFFAQFLFGIVIVFAKVLMVNFPIFILLSLRFFIVAIILGLVVLKRGDKIYLNRHGERLNKKDWFSVVTQALAAGLFFNCLILSGLYYTDATSAGIISSTTPAVMAVMSFFLLRERLGSQKILGITVTILGLLLLSMGKKSEQAGAHEFLGDFLVLLSVFPEALFTIIAKWHDSKMKPFVMTFVVNVINTLSFLPLAFWHLPHFHLLQTTITNWIMVLAYALCTCGFYIFWYRGLENSSASTAGIFTSVMPVSTTVIAYFFLGEWIHWYQFLGMSCVILSIVIAAVEFKPRQLEAVPG